MDRLYVIADDPCLEQYEFCLYKEKGKGAASVKHGDEEEKV